MIFLLIRATSLFRSVLSELAHGSLDAYDAVRRAYLETWLLAFDLRLEASQAKAARWHTGQPQSWSPDIQRLQEYLRLQGITEPMLGHDYGGVSEVVHPTRAAAENSVAVVTAKHGDGAALASVIEARRNFESRDVPMMMYRFIWLVLEERAGLINTGVDPKAMATAVRYVNEYAKTLAPSPIPSV